MEKEIQFQVRKRFCNRINASKNMIPKRLYRHKSGTVHKVITIANKHTGKPLVIHYCEDGRTIATPIPKWLKEYVKHSTSKNNVPWTQQESDAFMRLFEQSAELTSIGRIREANSKLRKLKKYPLRTDDACTIHYYKIVKL